MNQDGSLLPFLVLAPPFIGFIVLTILGQRSRAFAGPFGTLLTVLSFVFSLLLFGEVLRSGEMVATPSWSYLTLGESGVTFQFAAGPLGALMVLIVSGISSLVHLYSIGYMAEDTRRHVFFQYLSLFTLSMLGLVLSVNWLLLYVFWELVGLASFLLIGFYDREPAARDAAKKAFITTRFGDIGLFAAIILIYVQTKSFAVADTFQAVLAGDISDGMLTAIALLIFLGAAGKSGQFPLHVWLPDAMEGPTPVSALIHAATMVAAGVYLVAFSYPIFVAAPYALHIVAIIGVFTAIFAATMALVQNDIKRVLAYSTISQLGYMMLALGVGSTSAAMFHLTTHAFFKALLFLAAGNIIHAVGTNDILKMGGLWKKMPVTGWVFLIGALALSGIPPLAGYFSKEEIIALSLSYGSSFFVLAVATAFLTAIYMGRLFFLVFLGEPREVGQDAHEAPAPMLTATIVLALLTVFGGVINLPGAPYLAQFLNGTGEAEGVATLATTVTVVGLSLFGFLFAYLIFYKGTFSCPLNDTNRAVYKLLVNRYYIDTFYEKGLGGLIRLLGEVASFIDRWVVDGIVRMVTGLASGTGRVLADLQNGQVQRYNALALFTLFLLLLMYTLFTKGVFG